MPKMENLDLPSPPSQIKDGKMARFCPSRGFILDLGGGWAFAVHFILSKIVGPTACYPMYMPLTISRDLLEQLNIRPVWAYGTLCNDLLEGPLNNSFQVCIYSQY